MSNIVLLGLPKKDSRELVLHPNPSATFIYSLHPDHKDKVIFLCPTDTNLTATATTFKNKVIIPKKWFGKVLVKERILDGYPLLEIITPEKIDERRNFIFDLVEAFRSKPKDSTGFSHVHILVETGAITEERVMELAQSC